MNYSERLGKVLHILQTEVEFLRFSSHLGCARPLVAGCMTMLV